MSVYYDHNKKVRFESIKDSNHNNGFESVKQSRSRVTLTVQKRGWHNTKKTDIT